MACVRLEAVSYTHLDVYKRQALGLTQEDLAAQLQVENVLLARDCISRIEIGTRFVADYELKLLAEKLDVSVNWLLNIEDAKE